MGGSNDFFSNYSNDDLFGSSGNNSSTTYQGNNGYQYQSGWMTELPSSFTDYANLNYDFLTSSSETGLWDWMKNNQSLLSTVGGAATAGISYYNTEKTRDQQKDQSADSLAWSKEQFAQQMAMQEAGMALEAERNAIMQATLDDKIHTRKRHNETINAGPGSAPKTIKMVR